ncbi:MAG: sulfite exporter TauE/SafE family protein [Bryobacteraceae bacterium]
MEVLLGFVIALAIALTGVGSGSLTTPLLIILFGVSPAVAVGTALTYGAIVKIASIPAYAIRRQINWRTLKFLLAGGIPGVVAGGFLLDHLKSDAYRPYLYMALGVLIVATGGFNLFRIFHPKPQPSNNDRSRLLPWFALPIGVEVGFSSAGAGALGSLLLLGLTPLSASEVVGTDLSFGLALAVGGSAIQLGAGNFDPTLLVKLVIGGLCGAFVGSFLSGRLAQRPLRIGVLSMLVLLGCELALHGHANAAEMHAVFAAAH